MEQSSASNLVALALTGERLVIDGDLAAALAAQGWSPDRLQDLRHARQEAEQPWPFPVAVEEIREVGFARFDALLASARQQLGLDGLVASKPAKRPLNADERRLSADRPPHW